MQAVLVDVNLVGVLIFEFDQQRIEAFLSLVLKQVGTHPAPDLV